MSYDILNNLTPQQIAGIVDSPVDAIYNVENLGGHVYRFYQVIDSTEITIRVNFVGHQIIARREFNETIGNSKSA